MEEEGHGKPADVRHEGVEEAATHCLLVALAQETLPAVRALVPVKTLALGKFYIFITHIHFCIYKFSRRYSMKLKQYFATTTTSITVPTGSYEESPIQKWTWEK